MHGPLPGAVAPLRHRMSLRTFNSEAAQRLQPEARYGRGSQLLAPPSAREDGGGSGFEPPVDGSDSAVSALSSVLAAPAPL